MITILQKPVYDFNKQYKRQEEYFDRFIDWLDKVWEPDKIVRATREEERSGIDLKVWLSATEFTFEVKTEFLAEKTGNLCFETVSYARPGNRGLVGWGLKMEETSNIIYIVPGPDDIYFFVPKTLQEWVLDPAVYSTLRPFAARNKDYVTLGVLMPLHRVRALCVAQGNLNTMAVKGDDLNEQ